MIATSLVHEFAHSAGAPGGASHAAEKAADKCGFKPQYDPIYWDLLRNQENILKQLPNIIYILFLSLLLNTACVNGEIRTNSLKQALGTHIKAISNTSIITVAKLKVIDVETAQITALKNETSIAGYPIVGSISELILEEKNKLIKSLLDDKNYISLRTRCKNSYFIGLRFIDNSVKVEFALGMPCQQAIWAIPSKNETIFWGSVLNDMATSEVLNIFKLSNIYLDTHNN